jgi:hypothetical protein
VFSGWVVVGDQFLDKTFSNFSGEGGKCFSVKSEVLSGDFSCNSPVA